MNRVKNPLQEKIEQRQNLLASGAFSVCTSNADVIEACLRKVRPTEELILLEATSNQVNQFGGYSGMKPEDYRNLVTSISASTSFPMERIVLGADHAGPLPWCDEPAEVAMARASDVVRKYVLAGFTKIHIDTSMGLGSERRNGKLPGETIARRAADLGRVVVDAYRDLLSVDNNAVLPVVVLGSEVPPAGGAHSGDEAPDITTNDEVHEVMHLLKREFQRQGLEELWENLVALVVQPGVEFGDEKLYRYDRQAAKRLIGSLKSYPGLVFEGHSTDYQNRQHLREMVEDGIAILKVGPALTFALREGLFALEHIEREILNNDDARLSNFSRVLEQEMLRDDAHWRDHYRGGEADIRIKLRYSYADRARYYLPRAPVLDAKKLLFQNLEKNSIPATLVSQYMPRQYDRLTSGSLNAEPEALVCDHVAECIEDYLYAVGHNFTNEERK